MTAFIAVLFSQVLVFDLIMANAKPFRPTSWRKPPRTYMSGLSVNLEGIVTNMNNRLDIYDACRKELRFPDWTPLKNEWDCERLFLPNKVSHLLSLGSLGHDYSPAPISGPARGLSRSA